jgi:hypothetical protein
MKNILFMFVILFVQACAHQSHAPTPEREPNRTFWIGKTGDELTLHPVFASFQTESKKTSKGIEVRSYKSRSGSISSASCYGSGCSQTSSEISCSNVFYLKADIITDYKRVGNCGEEQLGMRPLDENDLPLMTEKEMSYYLKNQPSKPMTCQKTADCFNGQSCKDNVCQSLGLAGRLFNP